MFGSKKTETRVNELETNPVETKNSIFKKNEKNW